MCREGDRGSQGAIIARPTAQCAATAIVFTARPKAARPSRLGAAVGRAGPSQESSVTAGETRLESTLLCVACGQNRSLFAPFISSERASLQ